jgi:hypothetical protein
MTPSARSTTSSGSRSPAIRPSARFSAPRSLPSRPGSSTDSAACTARSGHQRADAHRYLDTARTIAEQLGEDRNDYGTEFGPSNVAIHALSIAVELGDAGQAI